MRETPLDFPFAVVGFDLDGTLVDTSADLAAAVNHALALEGRAPLALEAVRPMIGGGARAMLNRGLEASGGLPDPERLDALNRALLTYYEAHISVHSAPFPGAVATLEALAARGVRLGVVTNKFERFARSLLKDLGLTGHFATIIGGDTLGPGLAKPSPAPLHAMMAACDRVGGRAAFVGDSHFDIDAARAAGFPSVAVSFGFLAQPVEDLGADAVIDTYDDLIPTLIALDRGAF